jgi:hypothetical protein
MSWNKSFYALSLKTLFIANFLSNSKSKQLIRWRFAYSALLKQIKPLSPFHPKLGTRSDEAMKRCDEAMKRCDEALNASSLQFLCQR